MIEFCVFLYTCEKIRLDLAINLAMLNVSRSQIQLLIRKGFVFLDNQLPKKGGVLVSTGAVVRVNSPDQLELDIPLKGKNQNLDIMYEDEHLLILNKAAGMVMHPGAGTGGDTIVHGLIYHCGNNISYVGNSKRPGIVHRLDKDTSGVVVIAKNNETHASLAGQLLKRTMSRFYLAWVWGTPSPNQGLINAPIRRHSINRKKMCVHEEGKSATTAYQVLKSTGLASLVKCKLITGRTHQIRVHMLHAGYSVIGDKIYKRKNEFRGNLDLNRQALHAYKLEFWHWKRKERMTFLAPLPLELQLFSEKNNLIPV